MHSYHHAGDRCDAGSRTDWIRKAAVRLPLLFGFWWVLTQGEPASWAVGVPTVLLATIISLWLSASSSWEWRLIAVPRFVSYFAYCSLKGGVDVARRACSPSLPLAPVMLDYALRLREGTARVFFANTVSLLPGTLSADMRGDTLMVHVLDSTLPVSEQLQRLEAVVARLFGSPIGSEHAEGAE